MLCPAGCPDAAADARCAYLGAATPAAQDLDGLKGNDMSTLSGVVVERRRGWSFIVTWICILVTCSAVWCGLLVLLWTAPLATSLVLLASVLVSTSFFVQAPLLGRGVWGSYRGALDDVFSAEQTSRLSPANNGLQPRPDARGRNH